MSEIRRKLVIVGDGACGKVASYKKFIIQFHLNRTAFSLSDLSSYCLLEGNIPRGLASPFARLSNPDSPFFLRSMSLLCSRTMSPMSKSTESMSNSPYGILLGRKIMIVWGPSRTLIRTSSSYVLRSIVPTRLTTYRKRYVQQRSRKDYAYSSSCSGSLRWCISAMVFPSFL